MPGGAFLRDRSLFRPTRQDHELGLQTGQQEYPRDRKAFAFQMIQPHFEFGRAVGLIDDPGTGVVQPCPDGSGSWLLSPVELG